MIAAVYARKSTDQNLPDAEKSVTRQVEHATSYAARKGWTVDPAHVYQDDGISGAEFVKRPGFLRLMNALKPRPPFQVLFAIEVLVCPRCAGSRRILGPVTEPEAVRRLLGALGLAAQPPPGRPVIA